MHRPFCAALFALLVLGPATLRGQETSSLLVLSKHDHVLSVVDPRTLQVSATIPVGDDPHEVVASADGTRAYVSNYGFGAFHTLAVVDLLHNTALPSIDLGALRGPHGLAFQGGKTWFTAEVAKALGRYDPASGKVDLILGTGQNRTHMIWVDGDGEQIVTSNVNSGTLSIFNEEPVSLPPAAAQRPHLDWNETVVRVGRGSEGFDVSPDKREVWVANAQDGTLSIVSLPGRQVMQTLQVNAKGANRLKFTPDGRTVLVSSGPELLVLDAASRAVKARVPLGHGSGGVLVEPGGRRAFVACGPDNYVAVIDLQTLRVAAHIQAGGEPDGMAWVTHH